MPLYEYRCPDCQGRFEIIQHLGDFRRRDRLPRLRRPARRTPALDLRRRQRRFGLRARSRRPESFAGCGGGQCGMGGGGCGGGDWN